MKVVDYKIMPTSESRDTGTVPVEFIDENSKLDTLSRCVNEAIHVSVDTETHDEILTKSGLWGKVRVISIATKNNEGKYNKFTIDVKNLDKEALKSILGNIKVAFAWNASFDQEVLEINETPVKEWRDVMLDESLLNTGINGRNFHLGLAVAAKRYFNINISGKGSVQVSYDRDSDLTPEQIRYAADDALVTLWLGEEISKLIETHGLKKASELEQGTRKFIYMMEITSGGFPFDLDGWDAYVTTQTIESDKALVEIAYFTGSESGTPDWNVNSDIDLKNKLNEFEPNIVRSIYGKLLGPTDSVDKASLTELKAAGSTLADLVLTYRKPAKLAQSFGKASLGKYHNDGRIRSLYKQCRTATGRLSSDSPNGQNLPGAMKAFMKPEEGKLMITADYSQAELRVLGYLASEEAWLKAFKDGVDLHDLTAKNMFGVDMDELRKTDPKSAKAFRTKVKATNFGMPYNMGASLLARNLSNSGVSTSVFEAKSIIDKYYKANPKVGAYLKERDKFVEDFAKNPGEVDWNASFKLLAIFQKYDSKRRSFKTKFKRYPDAEELLNFVVESAPVKQRKLFEEESESMGSDEKMRLIEDIDWAFRYDAPVVLRPNGDPVAFESRTISGRRRYFTIPMDNGFERTTTTGGGFSSDTSDKFSGVVTIAAITAAITGLTVDGKTDKSKASQVRDSWAEENNISLPVGYNRLKKRDGEDYKSYRERVRKETIEERKQIVKAFEGKKDLKLAYVLYTCKEMGDDAAKYLLNTALAESIRKNIGAFRNHPIQGSVADIAELSFSKLITLADEYPDLLWVQTVHDSISGECSKSNAKELTEKMKSIMEESMERLLPGVPAKVDAEYGTSLDESDVIEKI